MSLLIGALIVYTLLTQRVLHAAGKPSSWLLAIAFGMVVTFAALVIIDLPEHDIRSRVWQALIILTGSHLAFFGGAAGLALTVRESRSSRVQFGAALALGATAALASPGIVILLLCLRTGDCL